MRKIRNLAASSLVLFLAACAGGCGGGGGASEPAAPLVIEAYGDSTMYGTTYSNGAFTQVAKPVPAQLSEALGIEVANKGVPGSTAAVLLTGYGENLPWAQQMAKSKAQVVYMNFGINDASDLSGETPESFRAALLEIVRIAKAAGKSVVLETPNPVGDSKYTRLPQFVAVTIAVAKEQGLPVVDQHAALSAMDWRALMSDAMQAHPTQAGYDIKASIALPALRAATTR